MRQQKKKEMKKKELPSQQPDFAFVLRRFRFAIFFLCCRWLSPPPPPPAAIAHLANLEVGLAVKVRRLDVAHSHGLGGGQQHHVGREKVVVQHLSRHHQEACIKEA